MVVDLPEAEVERILGLKLPVAEIQRVLEALEFKIDGDTMEGTLVLLPDKSVGRRVKVKRVSEDQLPPAPGLIAPRAPPSGLP